MRLTFRYFLTIILALLCFYGMTAPQAAHGDVQAQITPSSRTICVRESATFDCTYTTSSCEDTSGAVTYQWFVDGTTQSEASSRLTFTAGTSSNTSTISCVVSTAHCGSSNTATASVTVNLPTLTFSSASGAPNPATTCGTHGVSVQFYAMASDSCGNSPITYAWTFGDGSSGSGAYPIHKYLSAGTYPVHVTATDNGGRTAVYDFQEVVNAGSPAALTTPSISSSLNPALTCNTVNFSASASESCGTDPITYRWNFGDPANTTATGQYVNFKYAGPGTYTVTVTATDGTNTTTNTLRQVVNATSITISSAGALPTSPTVCDTVQFSANASNGCGSGLTYNWTFGDGSSVTGSNSNPTHKYTSAGTYTVKLIVSDGGMSTPATTTFPITVRPSIVLGAPTGLQATTIDCSGTVRVSWASVDGAAGYNVYHNGTKIGTTTASYFFDANEPPGVNSYNVAAINGCGLEGTASASVTATPYQGNITVTISPSFPSACTNRPIQFTASYNVPACESASSPTITWYVDGVKAGSTSSTLVTSFATAGSHNVACVVTSSCGCGNATAPVTVTAAKITFSSASGYPSPATVYDTVQFSAMASCNCPGATISYAWDFGDQSNTTGQNPTHRYAAAGTYTVTVTASDGIDSPATATFTIKVTNGLNLMAHVVWTSDYTTSPVTQTASTSGQFGGNSTVHLTLIAPQNLSSATATNVTIHEVSGTTADLVYTNLNMNGVPSSVCGEPGSNPPPNTTARYLDLPWNVGGHNGNYTVTATVSAVVGGSTQTVTLASPLTVDREDLLITATSPSNPAPLIWDPAVAAFVPIAATIQSAYKTNASVTMQIYQSDQILIRTITIPSAAYPLPLIVGGSGSSGTPLTFTWDGKKDDGSAADAGIFMYQFVVTGPNGDKDTDKSQFLTLTTPPASDAVLVSDDGTTATYNVSYILTSSPDPNLAGSSGQIDVYDPSQKLWKSQLLAVGDLQPGSHTVLVSMPTPNQEGDYKFLVSVKDNAASRDKGGRMRYALQHNNGYNFAIITLIESGIYHIAWCRANHPVQLRTLLPSSGLPEKHAPRNWTDATPLGKTRAAVNGNFYDPETTAPIVTKSYPQGELFTIQIYGEIGLNGNWKTYIPGPKPRACFGMKSTLTDLTSFGSYGMQPARGKRGKMIPNNFVVADGIKAGFPYGFSDVGFLVNQQRPQPPPVDDKGNSIWPYIDMSRITDPDPIKARTAIGWSNNGDFFLITSLGSSWQSMKTWCVDPSGFFSTNKELKALYTKSQNPIRMQTVMMLDGGSSPELGYFDNALLPVRPNPYRDNGGQKSAGYYLPNLLGVYYP